MEIPRLGFNLIAKIIAIKKVQLDIQKNANLLGRQINLTLITKAYLLSSNSSQRLGD
jgi:hypothetical protein